MNDILDSSTIKKFTEIINPINENDKKKQINVYGTMTSSKTVKIDGGEDISPCICLMKAKEGERVNLIIKNGTVYVTGNASSPATDDSAAGIAGMLSDPAVAANILDYGTRYFTNAEILEQCKIAYTQTWVRSEGFYQDEVRDGDMLMITVIRTEQSNSIAKLVLRANGYTDRFDPVNATVIQYGEMNTYFYHNSNGAFILSNVDKHSFQLNDTNIHSKCPNLDINKYEAGNSLMFFNDKNSKTFAYIGPYNTTSHHSCLSSAYNASGTNHYFGPAIDASGNKTFYGNGLTQLGTQLTNVVHTSGNETVNGQKTFQQTGLKSKHTGITIGTVPSSNQYIYAPIAADSANYEFGWCRQGYMTNGTTRSSILTAQTVNGTKTYNELGCAIDAKGTRSYVVSDANAFRTAIGANNASNLTTGSIPPARLPAWTSIGNTTGYATLSYTNLSTSGYREVMVVAYYSTTYWCSLILQVGNLHDTTKRECYLSGGLNDTAIDGNKGRGCAVNLCRTSMAGVIMSIDSTNYTNSARFYLYARK